MAVKINANKPQERKLYTGIANCVVQAINPDKKELGELLGIEIEKEPKYLDKTEEGVERVRIDVYIRVANKDISAYAKMAFFLYREEFISKSGKKQFINRYGKCTWAESKEALANAKHFDNVDPRPVYRGEEQLHKFLIAWLNPKGAKDGQLGDDCRLDEVEKYFDGDFSELQALVEAAEENEFRPLWGVKTVETSEGANHYQDVFTGKFDRGYMRSVRYDDWNKALDIGGEYPWGSDYQNVLDRFQEYSPKTQSSATEPIEKPTANTDKKAW